MQEAPHRTLVRRSYEGKLQIGDTILLREGVVGVVLARYVPSGQGCNEVHYIVQSGTHKADKGDPGEFMIDLESEAPFVHWTADGFNLKGSHQNVEHGLWHQSPILSYVIAESSVTFDAPPEWGNGASPVCLRRTSYGHYE